MPRTTDLATRERFADAVISGLDPVAAAQEVGFTSSYAAHAADVMMATREYQERVERHQEKLAMISAWSADRVIRELSETADEARMGKIRQMGAAVRAYELIGRHIGMWPREAPQVNIDARSITLGSDIIEAVGGVEGLRRMALPPGDEDDE